MFRPVRRKSKEISADETKKLLKTERRGVLAVNGEDGYPYAIPVNYLYCEDENKIIFHGARVGYKAEMIEKNDKVCFTVYGNVTVKDEEWAPYVQSAVIFGRCRAVGDYARTIELVRKFADKYYPDKDIMENEIAESGKAVRMFEIEIEHISGKEIQER